jgi:hypothetical protein
MRGDDNQQEGMFSYISPEKRAPADHPLRPIRKMVDEILKEMSRSLRSFTPTWGVRRWPQSDSFQVADEPRRFPSKIACRGRRGNGSLL